MLRIRYIAISIFLLYLLLITSFQFVNYSNSLHTLLNLTNNSKILSKLHLFPWPYLTIKEINTGQVSFNSATCKFSLFSLLTLSPKINYIDIDSLHIVSSSDKINIMENYSIAQEIFGLRSALFPNTKVFAKELFVYSKNPEGNIDLIFDQFSIKNNVIKMKHNDELITITATKSEALDNIEYNITHPSYSIKKVEMYKDGEISSGSLNLSIKQLSKFLKNSFIFDNYANNTKYGDIAFDMNFNFNYQNGMFNFEKITIKSPAINGDGWGSYSYNNDINSSLNLKISDIDLNELFMLDGNHKIALTIPQHLPNINSTIETIKLLNEEAKDIKIVISNSNLREFSGIIASGGNFSADGLFSSNQYRSMFEGKATVNHNDLNALLNNINLEKFATDKPNLTFTSSSDVRLTDVDVQLLNMLTQIDDVIFSTKFTNKQLAQTPYINAFLEIANLDLKKNKYPFFSYINSYFDNLLPKKSTNNYELLVNSLINDHYSGHIDLVFSNSKIIDSFPVKDLSISLDLEPLKVEISAINYANDFVKAAGSGSFSVSNIKPNLELNLDYDYADISALNMSDAFNDLLKIGDLYDFKQMSFVINSKVKKLLNKDSKLRDIVFNISNYNNVINILKLSANYGEGNFEINGNAILYPITLNLGYALNSFPSEFIRDITNNMIPMSGGVFSAGGTLYGIGENFDQFIYNLLLSGNFIGKKITYNNLALDDLVTLINNHQYDRNNLESDIDSHLSSGSTVFQNLEGGFNFIKGVCTVDELKFNTTFTSDAFSFNYNLYNYDINANFISSFYISNLIETGAMNNTESNELGSFKLSINGNLANMNKSFDYNALNAILAKRAK